MNRKEIKQQAREALAQNRWMPVLVNLIQAGIIMAGAPLALFITGPLAVGQYKYYNKSLKGENPSVAEMFGGFKDYGRSLGASLLMMLYQMLWSFIPFAGIIKSYSYAMTYQILNDHPELNANGAITKSREMMNGHKWEFFVFQLSFLGWYLLDMLTCGIINLLYIAPYYNHAVVAFYEKLKKEQ